MVFFFQTLKQTNKYKDIDEVQGDNAILGGWIPGILPKSAYDIEEKHNLDTNIVFGSFKYIQKDEESFIKNLTLLPENNNSMI